MKKKRTSGFNQERVCISFAASQHNEPERGGPELAQLLVVAKVAAEQG